MGGLWTVVAGAFAWAIPAVPIGALLLGVLACSGELRWIRKTRRKIQEML